MKRRESEERAKLWRLPKLGNVELLHATYVTQTFARHSHDGFAVGVIERGALGFSYRGENLVASPGMINLVVPGEPHTGHAALETGWTYRMFYVGSDVVERAASELRDRPSGLPFFRAGVIQDSPLAGAIRHLHLTLERAGTPTLEAETRFLWMLTQWITRHADEPPIPRHAAKGHPYVRRIRDYLEAHFDEDISIEQLSGIAGLSPFHLIRAFGNEVGLPPHAYLIQVRARRARTLLSQGWSVSAAAFEAGFADQSHLTRHFKRIYGITPGQYSKIVQDSRTATP